METVTLGWRTLFETKRFDPETMSESPNRTATALLGAWLAHFHGSLHGVPPGWRLKVEGKKPDSGKQENRRKSRKTVFWQGLKWKHLGFEVVT